MVTQPTAKNAKPNGTRPQNQARNSKEQVGINFFGFYVILSAASLGILYTIFQNIQNWLPIHFLMIWLSIAFFLWVVFGYNSSIRRSMSLHTIQDNSMLHKILSGIAFRLIITGIIAFFVTGFSLANMLVFSDNDWISLSIAVFVLGIVYYYMSNTMQSQFTKKYRSYKAKAYAFYVSIPIFLGISYLLQYYSAGSVMEMGGPEKLPAQNFQSDLVHKIYSVYYTIDYTQTFVLDQVGSVSENSRIITLLVGLALQAISVFGLLALFSIFLIPLSEFKWIIQTPTKTAEEEGDFSYVSLFFVSAFTVIIILFAIVPSFTYFERSSQKLAVETVVEELAQEVADYTVRKVYAEEIDGSYYRIGTKSAIEREEFRELSQTHQSIKLEIDSGYNAMENNLELYLDWYYSLTAEYVRTFKLLSGGFEEYLKRKLKENLLKGQPFHRLQRVVDELDMNRANEHLNWKIKQILRQNAYSDSELKSTKNEKVEIEVVGSWDSAISPDFTDKLLSLGNFTRRLKASGGVGVGIGAGVSGLIVKKAVKKGTFKLAAKAVAKAASGKLVGGGLGASGGAAAGAAVGSVVPLVGTAIGAIIGGVVGGVAGAVAVDAGILKLEEIFGRKKFKAELLASIRQSKRDLLASLERP